MSGISCVSASNTTSLLDYLNSASKTSAASASVPAGQTDQSDQAGPPGFLSSELQQQGYSGTNLDDLLKKIQDAVQSAKSGSDGPPDRNAIRDAVNQVLKDAGVDTNKIDNDFKAAGHAHHHHHAGAKSGQDSEIDPLLESLGVDPTEFKSALQNAIQNVGSDGSIDVSKLFASAAVGSQINLQA
jgi:hypothetical protein